MEMDDEVVDELDENEIDVGEILKVVGCEMFSRKLLKLKKVHESLPTMSKLKKIKKNEEPI